MAFQSQSSGFYHLAARIQNNKFLQFGGFTALYAGAVYFSSRRKLMWNDELYTYYIARLPGMTDVWGALMTGGEQLPPFFYLVTRASISLFGLNPFALRLPAMIGFWVMCLCMFLFITRRAPSLYGLIASILPLITFTYFYSYEARPYGLVLGFGALALLNWQSATMNIFRRASLIGLTLSLGGAISSHYYGVFVVLPLILGEVVRTYHRRRIDWPMWPAFVLAFAPLLLHLPLIARARAYSGTFWAAPAWMNIPGFYINMLYMTVLPLLAMLFVGGIYQAYKQNKAERESINTRPVHEVAAALGFLLIPIICVLLAKTVTGAFTDRYAVSAIIGVSLSIALAASKICRDNAAAAVVIIICMVGWFSMLMLNDSWKASTVSDSTPELKINLIRLKGDGDLPIVAADPYTFIELEHYAPADISSRVLYLASPDAALRHLKHNSIERGTVDLIKPWFGLNVVDYNSYIAARPRFLLCGDPNFFSWIIPQLEADGMQFEFKGMKGKILLFVVSPGNAESDFNR